jgi:glycosyltransferase involved in cell wall biosynthesis
MTAFKIIINCGPCEQFIEQCLQSVLSQSFENWEALVTVDPCGDDTFERALQVRDPRIRFFRNAVRRYSLRNQIRAIELSNAGPEDVIVSLDGDDWFARNDALQIIADTYERSNCWMTYGSWVSNALVPDDGERWPAYREGTTDFRRARWLATAVRTWKKWLWDRVSDVDLRDDAGEYFRIAEDRAIMLPLLEMAGTSRAKHIPETIMIYNQLASQPVSERMNVEKSTNVRVVHGRPPYQLLAAPTN